MITEMIHHKSQWRGGYSEEEIRFWCREVEDTQKKRLLRNIYPPFNCSSNCWSPSATINLTQGSCLGLFLVNNQIIWFLQSPSLTDLSRWRSKTKYWFIPSFYSQNPDAKTVKTKIMTPFHKKRLKSAISGQLDQICLKIEAFLTLFVKVLSRVI